MAYKSFSKCECIPNFSGRPNLSPGGIWVYTRGIGYGYHMGYPMGHPIGYPIGYTSPVPRVLRLPAGLRRPQRHHQNTHFTCFSYKHMKNQPPEHASENRLEKLVWKPPGDYFLIRTFSKWEDQPSTINHQQSIINHQSPITNHQSSIINHQCSTIKPAWGIWEASGKHLGASGKHLGSIWEASGRPLGSIWGHLGLCGPRGRLGGKMYKNHRAFLSQMHKTKYMFAWVLEG